jgi:hypothetical protein
MRRRAIFRCIWHGLLPWWIYEDRPHYDCAWSGHAKINAAYAWRWITGEVDADDVAFEAKENDRAVPLILWRGLLRRGLTQLARSTRFRV